MADLVRVVDSISATPTTLLDLNDETSLWTRRFSAPPPRLRRSVAANTLRDGDYDAASSYSSRVVEIDLESIESTQDAAASTLQTLFRLLDSAAGKFLQYQPQGASKPVFFVLRRSDTSALVDAMAQAAMRTLTLELNTEPFALGLMETLGPYTVSNDPAAVSNGCYFDATGVIGDVAAPALLHSADHRARTTIALRSGDAATSLITFMQAEDASMGTDTSVPVGGPDAAMSGTGTNNYARTTFATDATMVRRLDSTLALLGARGVFKVYAVVRRSDSTSTITIGAARESVTSEPATTVELPLTTDRILVPLGTLAQPDMQVGAGAGSTYPSGSLELYAERTSGAGTLDWDCIILAPADESTAVVETPPPFPDGDTLGYEDVFDAERERAFVTPSWTASGESRADVDGLLSGRLPSLKPNTTNRLVWLVESDRDTGEMDATVTNTVEVHYWPRYVFIRPATS